MLTDKQLPSRQERSKDFRFVFGNSFGLKIADNDIMVVINNEQIMDDQKLIMQELGLIITPRSLKLLAHLLNGAVEVYEEAIGKIDVPKEKLDEISAGFKTPASS